MRLIGPLNRTRTALLALGLACWPGLARADRCRPASEASASSKDGRFTLKAHFDRESWSWRATLADSKTGKVAAGTFAKIGWHAHFRAFVSDDGSRVVLFEPIAGRGDGDRVLIFDGSFRLLKSFGLGDLLTPEELGQVRRTVSHLHFSERDPARDAEAWLMGDTFAFRALGGRTVRVALADPKILDHPEPDR